MEMNEDVVNISGLRTDEGIADILNRLKSVKTNTSVHNIAAPSNESNNSESTLEVPVESVEVKNAPQVVAINKEEKPVVKSFDDSKFVESDILPWFNEADKDNKLIHYVKFDDSGNINYYTIKATEPDEDIAALKMKPDFICDIDYYKSRHFVLCVKQFNSDYSSSRVCNPVDESFNESRVLVEDAQTTLRDDNSANDGNNPTLEKVPTEDVETLLLDNDKYYHYVVFTDLGVADFIVRQDDLPFPFGESNLSKWFEEISNQVPVKFAKYSVNSRQLSNEADSIKDFKYDIITMHRPGVVTLDSVYNSDSDYQVHLKLKNEFSFIPINRVLGCLKYYATHSTKSHDDFKRMINKYFDVVI